MCWRTIQPRTKINIGLFCYFSAMMIVPSEPSPYIFFIDTIGTIVSLTSVSFIVTFYFATVPAIQRTCIQGLSRLMLVCFGLLIIREYIVSFLVNLLHDSTQTFLLDYPRLSCSFFNPRITAVPLLLSLFMLEASRLALLLFPMRFQILNHGRIVKLCIAMTVELTLLDLLLSSSLEAFPYYDTIRIRRFSRRNKFVIAADIPENQIWTPILFLSVS